MPITINGTGTVTGISAGGLPDACITTDDLAANAASGLAKAWVNFNGTGTVAIRASFNVSSITDNGTGDYTVNFTTAMVDANYSAQVTPISGGLMGGAGVSAGTGYTTSSIRIGAVNDAGSFADSIFMAVSIFR
jgi:hypothetical protein